MRSIAIGSSSYVPVPEDYNDNMSAHVVSLIDIDPPTNATKERSDEQPSD
jgi:hypothetical protein